MDDCSNMSERWLLVGFTHHEIQQRKYPLLQNVEYVTLDRGDDCPNGGPNGSYINFIGDAFDVDSWRRVMSCYGPASFDIVFTDGGMFGMKRVDEIIHLKHALLKDDGHVINYTSPIGTTIRCPFGRPYQYSLIPKAQYDIRGMEIALQQQSTDSLGGALKAGLNIIM
jgi:hypothetical protein